MATSKATLQEARPRRRSFTSGKKEQIRIAFTKYAGQGLDLVAIMFRLHNEKIADVPEGLLRRWNDDWKITVNPRHRCRRHDEDAIYPDFEQLYSSSEHTLDDIVFILYDRLLIETTKSSLIKMRNKRPLERRYKRRLGDAQGATTLQNQGASTVQIDQVHSTIVTGTDPSDPAENSAIRDENDDWEGAVGGIEDQDLDDIFPTLTPVDSASMTTGNWLNSEIAQELSMDIGDFDCGDTVEYISEQRTYAPPYNNEPNFGNSNCNNSDVNVESIAVKFSGNNLQTGLPDAGSHGSSGIFALRHPTNRDFCCFDDTPSSGLSLTSMHEQKIIDIVREYLFWIRQNVILSRGLDADDLRQPEKASVYSPDHSDEWRFYGCGFNASQSSISPIMARRQQAQDEWRETKKLAILAFRRPTARLVVCILLFYANAYVQEARGLHKHNFQVLCKEAQKHMDPNNPLIKLLKHLAEHLPNSNNMSAAAAGAGTEIIAMNFLADFLLKDPSFDFNTKYEAQELCISADRNNDNLSEAERRCDKLIVFSIRHAPPGDPAPLRRAVRRKGRILRDQNHLDRAWDEFMWVHKEWESDGKPCSTSKEYNVYEDLAKICRQKGEFAKAADYFRLAAACSDLFDFPNNRSDACRISELSDLMGKAYISSMNESGGGGGGGGGSGATTTTMTTMTQRDPDLLERYLEREVTRW